VKISLLMRHKQENLSSSSSLYIYIYILSQKENLS
jgi:hypothetical protein